MWSDKMIGSILKINIYQGDNASIEVLMVFTRIFIALIMGGLLGYEREIKNKPAGIRTISLVCVGAAMIGILQIRLQKEGFSGDITRMGAQVISGVGFIGGGAILQTKGSVQGLTTATTLWLSACLGLVIGYGMIFFSVISFISIFLILIVMNWIQEKFLRKKIVIKLKLKFNEIEKIGEFFEIYSENNYSIKMVDMKWSNYLDKEAEMMFVLMHGIKKKELIEEIKKIQYLELM